MAFQLRRPTRNDPSAIYCCGGCLVAYAANPCAVVRSMCASACIAGSLDHSRHRIAPSGSNNPFHTKSTTYSLGDVRHEAVPVPSNSLHVAGYTPVAATGSKVWCQQLSSLYQSLACQENRVSAWWCNRRAANRKASWVCRVKCIKGVHHGSGWGTGVHATSHGGVAGKFGSLVWFATSKGPSPS